MPTSLVSCYGDKPQSLTSIIEKVQSLVLHSLKDAFQPYKPEQVHATIIGMETVNVDNMLYSKWCIENQIRVFPVNWKKLSRFLIKEIPSVTIQMGGYERDVDYGFESRGESPYMQSFSIHANRVVINGWPVTATPEGYQSSQALYHWRKQFQQYQLCHKWNADGYQDNDFFMVLGTIKKQLNKNKLGSLLQEARGLLTKESIIFTLSPKLLSLVHYQDTELPMESTRVFPLHLKTLRDFQHWV